MNTDIADLIAGALGVSRGTAYDMMREALVEESLGTEKPAQQQNLQDLWHKVWPDTGAFVRASADDLTQFAKAVSAYQRPAQQKESTTMSTKQIEALKLALEFNRYFTSANGVDVPYRISVPRDEWREVYAAFREALTEPTAQPSKPLTDDDLDDIAVVARIGNLYDLRLTIEAKLRRNQ